MEKRSFLKIVGLGVVSYLQPGWTVFAADANPVGVRLSEDGSDRATAYACSNKIVRRGDRLFVGWLDAPVERKGPSVIRLGVCDGKTGALLKVFKLGEGKDNHCGPALALDGNNRLHVILGSHHQPFTYRYSDEPEKEESWSLPERIGARASYPSLIVDGNNVLHLTWRDAEGTRWILNYARKRPGAAWEAPREIAIIPYATYANWAHCISTGPDGRLHLTFLYFYSATAKWTDYRGRAVAHVYSDDGGEAWFNDGKKAQLPLTDQTASLIYKLSEDEPGVGLGVSNHVVDHKGGVWVTINVRGREQGMVFRGDTNGWKEIKMGGDFKKLNFAGGATVSVSRTPDNQVLMAMPLHPEGRLLPWGDPAATLLELKISENEPTMQSVVQLTKPEADRSSWLPSYEMWDWARRSTSCQGGPWLAYTRGRNAGDITNKLRTEVWLAHPAA